MQEEYTMKLRFDAGAALAALTLGVTLAASMALPAHAQKTAPAATTTNTETGSPTRSQVKMDTKEFLRTHRWNEIDDTWSMRSGMEPPAGVMSRADVKAQRDTFLSNNRWDNVNSQYVPIKPGPRVMSSLSRAQVKAETAQFMRTHEWDEETSMWKEMPMARGKGKGKM
jgi:hypothetical protein